MTVYEPPGTTGKPASAAAAVRTLVERADLELIPLRNAEEKLQAVPLGTTIAVTSSAKLGLGRTLEFARRAARAGFTVVPHLAARQLTDEAELRSFVTSLAEAGITRLYLIGGDAPQSGPYSSSLEVLQALQGIDHDLRRIGVACYPEGHPKIADAALAGALSAKQPYAAYMVSQMCFNPDVMVSWLRQVREAGITLPLHLGLAAPMQVRKLIELSPKLGVGSSVRYLAKQHGFLGNVLKGGAYQPESLLLRMGNAVTSPGLGIEGLHFFSFNQVSATLEWQRNVTARRPADNRASA
jgi:methylenetetrahydrofolate reductase (NADPH)